MQIPFTDIVIYLSSEGRWFVLAWLAVLGGIFGSFMNVVVYRLPRHISLSHPGSRCPACEHPIRWHDNVPIVGWLKLRGRCRDCGAAISVRYPLVEALVAAISSLIAWTEGMPEIAQASGDAGGTYGLQLGLYAFHLLLICTLVCAALVEFDGHVLPARIWVGVLIVGLVVPIFRPDVRSIGSVLLTVGGTNAVPWARGIIDGIAGLLSALSISIVPCITWYSTARHSKLAYATSAAAELLLVGGFLGDQAVIATGLGGMALYFATRVLARKWPVVGRFGWAGPLTVVTLVWVVCCRQTLPLAPGIATDNEMIWAIVAGLIMAVLAIVLQFVPLPEQPVKKS
ncbi:MAG: prepilin peptidase [Planctomycetia bacterium]|nr:prepilin peptidase [Planctomycetia bacterium]